VAGTHGTHPELIKYAGNRLRKDKVYESGKEKQLKRKIK
jgi:hypothetical protein